MAETAYIDSPQETADADLPEESASEYSEGNRLVYAVMAGLAFVFILGSIVASSMSEKTPVGDEGFRALVLPPGDIDRTVVVPPCATGRTVTARNVAAQVQTPGATVARLPGDILSRTLLIPRCSASTSAAGAKKVALLPSSLFVLASGALTAVGTEGIAAEKKKKEKKKGETGSIEPVSQLIVPSGSEARTVVVPPCTGEGRKGRVTVLSPSAESPTAVIAPRC